MGLGWRRLTYHCLKAGAPAAHENRDAVLPFGTTRGGPTHWSALLTRVLI